MTDRGKTIAVYYEHPDWFRPLFAELDRRGTPYARLDAARHRFDPGAEREAFALLFNRMSASAYLRGHGNAVFYTRYFLEHLEGSGKRVVNGPAAFALSRQDLPIYESTREKGREGVRRGAYVLEETEGVSPQIVLVGTGSELQL